MNERSIALLLYECEVIRQTRSFQLIYILSAFARDEY